MFWASLRLGRTIEVRSLARTVASGTALKSLLMDSIAPTDLPLRALRLRFD